MIEPMAKFEIIGLYEELDGTLDLLQRLGTVEIIEIPTIEEGGHSQIHRIHLDKSKEDLFAGYNDVLSTVSELLEILEEGDIEENALDGNTRLEISGLSPDELGSRISKISREIRRLGRQRRNLQEDLISSRQYETLINAFLPLLKKAGPAGDREQIGLVLKKGESVVLPILRKRIDEISGDDTLIFHKEMQDGSVGVYIVIAPGDVPAIRELLGNEGVAEYHIPREYRKKSLEESIETIHSRIESIPGEIAGIDKKLSIQKKENVALLRYIHSFCTDRLNQLRVLPKLVRTKYTFALSGWTPVSRLDNLNSELHGTFGDRVHVGRVKLNELDFLNIPTLLNNRGTFRAFEVLTKLLPPPKYDNLDATPFITVFFPLFFGIILGDIAYGLLLMAIAGFVKWKWRKIGVISDVGTVALIAGLLTVLFGFIYGEFLGDIGEHYFNMSPLAPWLHRAGAIEFILLIAIGLGVVHIVLGFALKTYVAVIMRHLKGVIEGLANITIIAGIVGIFTQLFIGFPPIIRTISFGFIVIGIVGVLFTEGIFGLLEILSMVGNILSYSRIMAVGLASVILAIVANRLAEASPNIFLGIVIGVLIHMVNFIMGVFSPTIHSLRLHYVEFFGKFFRPSGRPFEPFRRFGEIEKS